jgi:hypothetical protein
MEFRTEIKWKKGTDDALRKLKNHLGTFEIDKETALRVFYPEVDEKMVNKTAFAVECGDSPQKSVFIFHLGTKNSSEVSGRCRRNQIGNLKRDWKFLKEKMDEQELEYKAIHTKIILNSEILEKTSFLSYLRKREILGFFVSLTGIPSIVSALLAFGFSWLLLVPFSVGFICWAIISCCGYYWEGEYVLK